MSHIPIFDLRLPICDFSESIESLNQKSEIKNLKSPPYPIESIFNVVYPCR
jgi:hypothetical protein